MYFSVFYCVVLYWSFTKYYFIKIVIYHLKTPGVRGRNRRRSKEARTRAQRSCTARQVCGHFPDGKLRQCFTQRDEVTGYECLKSHS